VPPFDPIKSLRFGDLQCVSMHSHAAVQIAPVRAETAPFRESVPRTCGFPASLGATLPRALARAGKPQARSQSYRLLVSASNCR